MSEEPIEVLVEMPKGSRQRYEYDEERQALRLDRRLSSGTVYPADDGFVAETLGTDGEPLGAMVLGHEPTFRGAGSEPRPIGLVWLAPPGGP